MTPADDAVCHWLIPLGAEPGEYEMLFPLLDDEQRVRAARIVDPSRRAAWVTAWAGTRRILGACLDCRPEEIRFVRDAGGKPHLPGAPLHFNLSHSGDWCLLAVSRRWPVGADVERRREGLDLAGLAHRCFSSAERSWWQSLPENARPSAFFRLWTCKEAFVKAVGQGIRLGLSQCEFDMGGVPRLVAAPSGCGAAQDWRIRIPPVAEGYSAALAYRESRT
ncbi:MAG TPA: 4'-phosphopantetheinyl transferase superfamily protein [Methylococcaceae bacterium]|nr:4'-phosphopantetheinyl transferase superfamily protein [Methylococcaceae bacterium]